MTTSEFIQKAQAIHGNKYDYSKVEYVGSKTKVRIICPKHGEFWQRTDCHLQGQKCPVCAKIENRERQIKWNYSKCYEEARKYSSIKAFQLGNISAYTHALKRGWLNDYTWFQTRRTWNNVWNKDNCQKEAQKYETVSLFRTNNESAYRVARKNGWLDEFFPTK